jgi:hypothetical protein
VGDEMDKEQIKHAVAFQDLVGEIVDQAIRDGLLPLAEIKEILFDEATQVDSRAEELAKEKHR